MRAHSILATAASVLLASTIFAAAQGTQKQGPGAEGSPSQGQTQREGQQGKQAPQQAPQKGNRGENTNQKNAPQAQEREGPKGKQQVQQGQKEQQGKQQGQNQKEQQGKQQGQNQKERTEGQGGGRAEGQKAEPKAKAGGSQKERTEGQGGGRTEGSTSTTLTIEQKTRVRETVLQGSNAPRANNVNFQVRVGTTVPTSVRVIEIAPVLVEFHPEWRGYFYFIVNDEIIVVDRNHRIVAVLEV